MPRTDSAMALDNQLCLAVYRASHAFNASYRAVLEPFDLTYPQYMVLLALWDRGPLTVSELGQALDLDSGTLSPLLTRLQRSGQISRARDGADGRVVRITVTEQGRALREQVRHVPQHVRTCAGVSPVDGRALIEQLSKLTASLRSS